MCGNGSGWSATSRRMCSAAAGNFFHVENWYSMHGLVRGGLRSVGLLGRARRNARRIVLRRNAVALPHLPAEFDGFTILQLTDLHIDAAPDYADVLIAAIRGLDYDLCVLTGDYRVAHVRAVRRGAARPCGGAPASEGHAVRHPRQSRHAAHGARHGGDGLSLVAQRMDRDPAQRCGDLSRRHRRRALLPAGEFPSRGRRDSCRTRCRSCCRIRRRPIAMRRMPTSI